MGNIDNQRAGAAGPAPQRRKLANLCFVLSNLTLLYRLLCYIPELSVPYLPVVSLWFLPYLFWGVGAYLLFAVPGRETYNQKTSNILFIIAAIFFLLPRLWGMLSGQPFSLTELAFCTALTYLALGFGCFVRFLEYDRLMKMSCWFMIVPGIFLGLMIVYHPIEALAVGIVLVVALAIFFGRLKILLIGSENVILIFSQFFADKGQSAVSYSFRYGRQEKAVFLGTLGGFDIIHIANPFDT